MEANFRNFSITTGSSLSSLLGNSKRLESLSAWNYDHKSTNEDIKKFPKPTPSLSPKMKNVTKIRFRPKPKSPPPEMTTLKVSILPIAGPTASPYNIEPKFRSSDSRKVRSRRNLNSNSNLLHNLNATFDRPSSSSFVKKPETPLIDECESIVFQPKRDPKVKSAVRTYREKLNKKVKPNEKSYDNSYAPPKSLNLSLDSDKMMGTTMASMSFEPKMKPKVKPRNEVYTSLLKTRKEVVKTPQRVPSNDSPAKQTIESDYPRTFYFHRSSVDYGYTDKQIYSPNKTSMNFKPKSWLNNSVGMSPKYIRTIILGKSYLIENKNQIVFSRPSTPPELAPQINSKPVLDFHNKPSSKIKTFLKVLNTKSPSNSVSLNVSENPTACPTPRIMISSPITQQRKRVENNVSPPKIILPKPEIFQSKDAFVPHRERYFVNKQQDTEDLYDDDNKMSEVDRNNRIRKMSIEPWAIGGLKFADPFAQANN